MNSRGVIPDCTINLRLEALEAKNTSQDAAIAANVDNSAIGNRVIENGKIYEVLEDGTKVYIRDVATDINGNPI